MCMSGVGGCGLVTGSGVGVRASEIILTEAEPWDLLWSCLDLQWEPDLMWLLAGEEGTDCAGEFATWKVY